MNTTISIVAFLLGTGTALATAQGAAVEDWTRVITLLGSNIYGTRAVVDAADCLYVTGYHPNYRIVTARFAADGTQLWQVDFDAGGPRQHASWCTVDRFGDLVVVGHLVTGGAMTPSGFVVLKYDALGNLLWSDVEASSFGRLDRVATDANGDIVVLGRMWAAGGGILTRKYARNGARLWTRQSGLSSSNQDQVGGLALDAAGNVFLTGGAIGTMLTIAYDPAGNLLWSTTTPAMGAGADLALGPAGEVYVGGTASGVTSDRTLIVKYDAAGVPQWVHNHPGIGTTRLAVDAQGDLVVAGGVSVNGGYFNWLLQKLDTAGVPVWSASYDHHAYNDELPSALAIGPDDEIYVTGQGGPGPASGNLSYVQSVTARFSRTGAQEWASTSFASVRGKSVVLLGDGSIAAVGESPFTLFHYRQAGVWHSLTGGLAGVAGVPRLEGTGSPAAGAAVTVDLTRGASGAPAWIVAGFSRANLPLFGGTLVPSIDLLFGPFVLSASGAMSLPATWPTGLPGGFEITAQAAILDAAAPFGFAASNALVGTSR